MSQMISDKYGAVGAVNDVVGPVTMPNANVTLLVGGTFVGTVELQGRATGDDTRPWVKLAADVTADGVTAVTGLAGALEFRAVCTAYTSGSAAIYLAACPTS